MFTYSWKICHDFSVHHLILNLSLCASLLVSENAFILEVGPLSSHEVDGVRKEKERLTASRS